MSINVSVSTKSRITARTQQQQNVVVNQPIVPKNLNDLADVSTVPSLNGSILVYDVNEGKFMTTLVLDSQTINGGDF